MPALLDAARQSQATEDRMSRLEERLRTLSGSEAAIRRSLEARRGVIAEILAALQRMGRRPPPAVLVNPEDVLAVIRTSMLLGAIVPEMRGEVDTLAADLAELVRLRGLIAADRQGLQNDLSGWAREQQRLAALVAARKARQVEVEAGLAAERTRAAELANQARSLKDLLDRVEGEVAAAKRAVDEAKAAEQTRSEGDAGAVRRRRHPRSGQARPEGQVRRCAGRRPAPGQRAAAARVRPAGRQWRDDARHFARHPGEGRRVVSRATAGCSSPGRSGLTDDS